MNLKEIQEKVVQFRDERDWGQFHNPKDLALSLILESTEILELFQWKRTEEEINTVVLEKKEELGEEISDVLIYLVNLAHVCDIDIEKAFLDKMQKNAEKYPKDLVKGSSKKYTEY